MYSCVNVWSALLRRLQTPLSGIGGTRAQMIPFAMILLSALCPDYDRGTWPAHIGRKQQKKRKNAIPSTFNGDGQLPDGGRPDDADDDFDDADDG